jgi:pimeloyl-ACP methyl ester carboxylesterase
MHTITSPDGTTIACTCSGRGPPLVLIHGTSGSSKRWTPVLSALERHFTVHAIDRRGYGESGDAGRYSFEREIEDVAAVVDSLAEPADLMGHSFGALCCLEAALRMQNLRRLILYEPAVRLTSAPLFPSDVLDRLDARLKAGDREGILAILFRELAQVSPEELAGLRDSPMWPARLASAHAVPRETRVEEQYEFDAQRFRNLRIPTLLLLGGESPRLFVEGTQAIAAALPDGRIAVMPGQRHVAMNTAPDMFLRHVLTFLLDELPRPMLS